MRASPARWATSSRDGMTCGPVYGVGRDTRTALFDGGIERLSRASRSEEPAEACLVEDRHADFFALAALVPALAPTTT